MHYGECNIWSEKVQNIFKFIFASTRDPVYREEAESFSLWWAKTPLGKRKQRYLELEQEAKQEKDKKSGDRRSKKKK